MIACSTTNLLQTYNSCLLTEDSKLRRKVALLEIQSILKQKTFGHFRRKEMCFLDTFTIGLEWMGKKEEKRFCVGSTDYKLQIFNNRHLQVGNQIYFMKHLQIGFPDHIWTDCSPKWKRGNESLNWLARKERLILLSAVNFSQNESWHNFFFWCRKFSIWSGLLS